MRPLSLNFCLLFIAVPIKTMALFHLSLKTTENLKHIKSTRRFDAVAQKESVKLGRKSTSNPNVTICTKHPFEILESAQRL